MFFNFYGFLFLPFYSYFCFLSKPCLHCNLVVATRDRANIVMYVYMCRCCFESQYNWQLPELDCRIALAAGRFEGDVKYLHKVADIKQLPW